MSTRSRLSLTTLLAAAVTTGLVIAVIRNRHAAVTAVCRLCGDDVRQWVGVVWEDRESSWNGIAVSHSGAMVDLCSPCGADIAIDIVKAVRAVVSEHRAALETPERR
jgi:hypothetical protein